MFDGLLKPKLYTKSKSLIKKTRTRLDAVRKKKSSVFNYLKNDVADLLKKGLDYSAYGRVEGLLLEQNMLFCYDLINSFCETISNNLSLLYKHRECPEECREAVPSLMYAAARFADFPELRDLRNLFSERYGNSLEVFMNEEFAEKSKKKTPTKEAKLQLLKEIADELSIEWNSKALEQRLYAPPPLEKPTSNLKDDGYKLNRGTDPGANEEKVKEYTASEKKKRKITSNGSKEFIDNDSLVDSSNGDGTTEASATTRWSTNQDGQKGISKEEEEEEADNEKTFCHGFIPQSYLKPKIDKMEGGLEEPVKEKGDFNEEESNIRHEIAEKQKLESVDQKENGSEDLKKEKDNFEEVRNNHRDDLEKPKPRSVRRRNSKPPPGRENLDRIGSLESGPEGKEERNGKNSDEEERILSGLLMHYSKKQSTNEAYLKPPRDRNVKCEGVDSVAPARAASLPAESTSPADSRAMHVRASSFQTEMVGHVHPKLPDYEQLAARFAALKGK